MAELMERKRLIDYLPRFMQNFSEIKELMRVANIESDQMYLKIGQLLNNAFIEDCDEYGIKKYERFLDITPSSEDTLERRKSRVLLNWNSDIPYTYRELIRRLNVLCGVNDYDISEDDYLIECLLYDSEHEKEVLDILEEMLPANMHYSVKAANKMYALTYIAVTFQDDDLTEIRQVTV